MIKISVFQICPRLIFSIYLNTVQYLQPGISPNEKLLIVVKMYYHEIGNPEKSGHYRLTYRMTCV